MQVGDAQHSRPITPGHLKSLPPFSCYFIVLLFRLSFLSHTLAPVLPITHNLSTLCFPAQVICTLWVFLLPNIKTSIYFHRNSYDSVERGKELESIEPLNVESPAVVKVAQTPPPPPPALTQLDKDDDAAASVDIGRAFVMLWRQFITSYSSIEVVQWSLWYALGTCGYYQVRHSRRPCQTCSTVLCVCQ